MIPWWRRYGWPILKVVLAVAIVVGVGRQFMLQLANPRPPDVPFQWSWDYWQQRLDPDLRRLDIHWGWLAASACLYLLFLATSASYWYRLLNAFGARPSLLRVGRAYYVGQLGKYVPGKAWALLLRAGLSSGPGLNFGTAVLTAFYEVLTTMAAGALLAAVVFIIDPPRIAEQEWLPLLTGLFVLVLVGLPLWPGIFNMLIQRLARRFAAIDALKTPRIKARTLAEGIAIVSVGWIMLGVSVWAALAAILPEPPPLTPATWAQLVGIIGLSYVAGFLALVVPGGVGPREYFLSLLLSSFGPLPLIYFVIVLMRLAWTSAELLAAGMWQILAVCAGEKDNRP